MPNAYRDQDVLSSNQSLRILSNLVAAGAIHASGLLDEIIRELLVFTAIVVGLKSSEVNDLKAKVHFLVKNIVDFDHTMSNFFLCILVTIMHSLSLFGEVENGDDWLSIRLQYSVFSFTFSFRVIYIIL